MFHSSVVKLQKLRKLKLFKPLAISTIDRWNNNCERCNIFISTHYWFYHPTLFYFFLLSGMFVFHIKTFLMYLVLDENVHRFFPLFSWGRTVWFVFQQRYFFSNQQVFSQQRALNLSVRVMFNIFKDFKAKWNANAALLRKLGIVHIYFWFFHFNLRTLTRWSLCSDCKKLAAWKIAEWTCGLLRCRHFSFLKRPCDHDSAELACCPGQVVLGYVRLQPF